MTSQGRRLLFNSLALIISVVVIIAIVLLVNTYQLKSVQIDTSQAGKGNQVSPSADVIQRLSQAIQFKTVTGQFEPTQFQDFLRRQFPRIHEQLNVQYIGEGGILIHWPAPDSNLLPVLMLAHYDVVPAAHDGWQHSPFSGHVDANYIWGRGTIDDKSSLMAMLEAMTYLLQEGVKPQRDLYLAFGHDEETGGELGAAKIADYLVKQQLQFEYILDEGLVIAQDILRFVDKPVALIGVAEKGYANIELTLLGEGGHASMPGGRTLVGQLAAALTRLENQPMPSRLTPPIERMLQTLAPESKFTNRVIFSNLWLFRSTVVNRFRRSAATHAAVTDTFAPTRLFASDKVNVLPHQVRAQINVRLLPGTSSQQLIDYINKAIHDSQIKVTLLQVVEASPVSSAGTHGYRAISTAIRTTFGDVLVAPGLVIPATDSRHYAPLSNATYRFMPIRVSRADLNRIHGQNERLGIVQYSDMIGFYTRLMQHTLQGQ